MKIKITLLIIVSLLTQTAFSASWFVNNSTGDDLFDGTSATLGGGSIGPKKTINAALLFASYSDTIYISDGLYEETLVIDKGLVIRGNNWGIDPLTTARLAETIIVSPIQAISLPISGNSLIEIKSCCVEIDGISLSGDNPNLSVSKTKYGEEFEISYGIAGKGNFDNLHFTNLFISNFSNVGINFTSGIYSTKSNLINKCSIKVGEDKSIGILFNENFYSNLSNLSIDSTGTGLILDSFNVKSGVISTYSFLDIRAELSGINLFNFSGNTDSIYFEYNNIKQLDPSYNFIGFWISNISSLGFASISTVVITDVTQGILIKNIQDKFVFNISDNTIANANDGITLDQKAGMPAINLPIKNCKITDMSGSGIYAVSEGGLALISLVDIQILKSQVGIKILGNTNMSPGNTEFTTISKYYIFLDSSAGGIKPNFKIDATQCVYDGIIGYNLINRNPYNVEDKIRHYLDRNYLGWVLFKNNSLYVTTRDGNYTLTPAFKVALNNWNVYLDSINSMENVLVDKKINLYTHHSSAIGKVTINNFGAVLYLHGKLLLQTGLELVEGYAEMSDADTLVVLRSNIGTRLSSGKVNSYVRGTLYMRYLNMPVNFAIKDTIPIGRSNDFRPFYINATWPAGISSFDIGFKTLTGKAPINKLPTNITHISDVRYWQVFNPFNQTGFNIKNTGVSYSSITNNDYVNDPTNLRLIYDNFSSTFNLGGSGSTAVNGSIMSTTGAPGYGLYTLGNAKGGNNILSFNTPIALINSTGSCSNDSIMISGSNSSSASAINNWLWQITGPSTVVSTENAPVIKKLITVPGNYTITLIITNSLGNKDTATAALTIQAIPVVQYTKLLPCFPLAIDLTNTSIIPVGTSLAQTEWKINSIFYTTTNLKFTPIAVGAQTGHLKVTLDNGCSDTIAVSVFSFATPILVLSPNGVRQICTGDSVKVKVTHSGGALTWNDGLTHDSIILKKNSFYKATNTASPQCKSYDSVSAIMLDLPTVDAGPSYNILPGKSAELKGSSNGMIEWTPTIWLNDATVLRPISRPLATIKYYLSATSIDGCEAKDSMVVVVNDEEHSSIPNLITPNGDGHNDKWVLSNIKDPQNCKVDIFTREGSNVYSSDSYKNDFDGTRDGKILPDGFYVFVIENKVKNEIFNGILNILTK